MTDSPLTQVAADSLSELFNKSPETLTEAEEMRIILALREERKRWNEAPKPVKEAKKKVTAELDIGDLEL